MTHNEVEDALVFADSYSRMGVLLDLFDARRIPLEDWFRALGECWQVCDNISDYRAELEFILGMAGDRHRKMMMTLEEQKQLAALPEVITVYRGCYGFNRRGLSWTLDRAIAGRFPFLHRYIQPHTPLLLTGRVRRDRCVLKLGRNEEEIIAPRVRIMASERLGVAG